MKNKYFTERLYNYLNLFVLVYIIGFAILILLDSKFEIFESRTYLHEIKYIPTLVLLGIVVLVKILMWIKIIPTYQPNPTQLIFHQFTAEKFPRLFKYLRIVNSILIIAVLIWAYLIINHKI